MTVNHEGVVFIGSGFSSIQANILPPTSMGFGWRRARRCPYQLALIQ